MRYFRLKKRILMQRCCMGPIKPCMQEQQNLDKAVRQGEANRGSGYVGGVS